MFLVVHALLGRKELFSSENNRRYKLLYSNLHFHLWQAE
jgi:hypothetical protein